MPSNFKVLAGASGEPIDPNFRNVTLLLHGDGNNGGQNNAFVDSSSNHFPISRNGNTTQGSFSPYGSNWSNYFDGSGDYFTVPYTTANFDWWTSGVDFTIEAWVFATNLSTWQYTDSAAGVNSVMVGNAAATSEVNYWSFGPLANGTVRFKYYNGANNFVTSTATITANTWNHVAMTKTSSGITVYVNGVAGTTTAISGTPQSSTGYPLIVGQINNATASGYISNLRIVRGTAIYSGNFTPPTQPLTAITNTSLLTCGYNRFRDGSTNNFTVTRNGDVRVTNFAPFAPSSPAAYDQSDVQYWSGSFNGGTDRVQVPVTSNMYLGTTYTIEAWAYYSGTSYGARPIFSQCESFQGGFAGLTLTLNTSGNLVAEYRPATSGTVTTITGPTVTPNTWFHIALVSDNSSSKLFVNGQQVGSTTTFGDYPSAKTTFVAVGSWGHGWNDGGIPAAAWIGYISNMRVVKGVAVYSTNFTPPTSPLTAVSGTVLLTCQNASFTDNSSVKNILTPVSNATVVGNSPYNPVGYWSNYFDGSGDYLSIPNNAALNMAGSTFTLECWIYPNGDYSDYRTIMSKRNASTTSYQMFLFQTTGYLSFSRANTAYQSSATPTANTWNHVAAVYDGTNINLYLNGTRVLQTAVSIADTTDPLLIGAIYTGGENFNGHISNARVLKGVQAYSGTTYTVPTTPLTAISGTSLLTCQANRFIDSSTNAFTITRNGDVAVRDFDPFTGASVTSTGGSGYFDGTGDNITVPRNSALIPTTGDFTVECWIYPFSNSGTQIIAGFIDGGVAGDWRMAIVSAQLVFWAGADVFYGTPIPYAWNHVMCCRSGSTLYIGINGVAGTQTNTSSLNNGTNYPLSIGGDFDANLHMFTGYISDFRIINGSAAYPSTTYTVPTSPIRPTTNTQLLCNFTNAAIFDNSMKNDLETVGSTKISTSVKKFGTGSIAFDGTTSYLGSNSATTDLYTFGTGDFTIEFWVYLNNTATGVIYDPRPTGTNGQYPMIYTDGGAFVFFVNSGAQIVSSAFATSTWHHVAVSRSGTSTKMFVNGTQAGSTYTDTNNYICAAGRPYIGINATGLTVPFNGYLDELRVTKGVARYTANFTAPTAPFPNK